MTRKGILLAGGYGTRLYPLTKVISKQLLPVHDKPMIYYPLSTLMLADIKDILIISTPNDIDFYVNLLGDGSSWGINLSYHVQEKPDGIAKALIIGENFLAGSSPVLILGDNIFYGNNFYPLLKSANDDLNNATIFTYHVKDPERYGVVEFDSNNNVLSLEEKPKNPKSSYAITGLYFYDNKACDYVKTIKPSGRGELEITDLNKIYLENQNLKSVQMDRGFAWLDTGTYSSLMEAGQFVSTIQNRPGFKISCPEEIAYRKNWINLDDLLRLVLSMPNCEYSEYLNNIVKN